MNAAIGPHGVAPCQAGLPARRGRWSARLLLPMGLALALAPGLVRAQIYAGSDAASGAVVLSNFRSDDAAVLVDGTMPPAEPAPPPASPPVAPGVATPAAASPSPALRLLVDAVATRNRLSPALVHAVILAESRYDPRAISAKGAVGLMQLMPATGRRFGARDLFSAEQNLAAGSGYLRWLMDLFDGHLDLVLAAYNAGEQAVIKAGCRVPAYPETQAYVRRILDRLGRQGEAPRWPAGRGGDTGCA